MEGRLKSSQSSVINMEPEDDFATWAFLLTSTIEPGSDYHYLLSGCTGLIQQIMNYFSLSPPLSGYTMEFMNDTVPKVIKSLLDLPNIDDGEELKDITTFITETTNFCTWILVNDKNSLMNLFPMIFDENGSFYKNNPINSDGKPIFQSMLMRFINDGQLDIILNRIIYQKPPPSIHHFDSIFSFVTNSLKSFPDLRLSTFIMQINNTFIQFLERISNSIHSQNFSQLSHVFDSYFKIMDRATQITTREAKCILSFLDKCIISEREEIQVFAASYLTIFSNLKLITFQLALVEWSLETDFISKFFLSNHSKEVVTRVTPVLSFLATKNVYTLNTVLQIWKQEFDDNQMKIQLVSMILSLYPQNTLFEFLANFENDMTSFYLLVWNIAVNKASTDPSTSVLLLNRLWDDINTAEVQKIFTDYFGEAYKKDFLNVLVQVIEKALSNNFLDIFFEDFMIKLFPIPNFCQSIEKDFYNYIIHLLKLYPSKCVDIFNFLFMFVSSYHRSIPNEILTLLLEASKNNEDGFWHFIMTLSSVVQFDLMSFIRTINVKSLTAKTIMFLLDVPSFKLDQILDFVVDALILTEDDSFFRTISDTLIQQVPYSQGTLIPQIYKLFNITRDTQTFNQTINNIIKFLEKLVNFYEGSFDLTNHKVVPHKAKHYNHSISVSVNYHNQNISVKMIRPVNIKQLRFIIAVILGIEESAVTIKINSFELKNDKTLIKSAENLSIEVKESEKGIDISQLPSMIISKINFQSVLLDLLGNSMITKNAWSLIQIIPSYNLDLDPNDIIESNNEYIFQYRMQLLQKALEDPEYLDDFTEEGHNISLIQFVEMKKFEPTFMKELLDIILQYFTDMLPGFSDTFAPEIEKIVLMKNIDSSIRIISFKLLTYCDIQPELAFLEASYLSLHGTIWPELDTFLNESNVFTFISDVLQSLEANIPSFSEIIVKYIKDEEKAKTISDLCLIVSNEFNVEGICSILSIIVTRFPNISTNLSEFVLTNVERAIKSSKPSYQKNIFILCQAISQNNKVISNKIQDILMLSIDQKNELDQAEIEQNDSIVCGLKNLGSTCYMNAVLQQLFNIVSFRVLIMKNGEGILGEALKSLFTNLQLIKTHPIDTIEFVEAFEQQIGFPINVYKQEDAVEFFTKVIDNIPHICSKIFIGKIKNIFKTLNHEQLSERIEQFSTISIYIQNSTNLEQAIANVTATDTLTGENQYQNDRGERIDAIHLSTLDDLPPVLVFHLNRFEFDPTKFQHYKINDRFVFPFELDMSRYGGELYRLSGAVLHNGTAECGHYISIISKDGTWMRMDDTIVSTIDQTEFIDLAYGGHDFSFNAYLLFYVRSDIEDMYPKPDKFTTLVDNKTLNNAKIENEKQQISAGMISQPTISMMMSFQSVPVKLEFFLKVICPSEDEKSAETFADHLIDSQVRCTAFLIDNRDLLVTTFLKVENLNVLSSVNRLLSYLIDNDNQQEMKLIVQYVVNSWNVFIGNYSKINIMYEFVYHYIQSISSYDSIQDLIEQLLEFVNTFYSEETSSYAISHVNFSSVFKALTYSLDKQYAERLVHIITQHKENLFTSQLHSNALIEILTECISLEAISIHEVLGMVSNVGSDNSSVLELLTQIVIRSSNDIDEKMLKELNEGSYLGVSTEILFKCFAEKIKAGNKALCIRIMFSPKLYLLPFIVNNQYSIRVATEELLYCLFPGGKVQNNDISRISNLLNKFVESIQKYVQSLERMYFETNRYLVKNTHFRFTSFIRGISWMVKLINKYSDQKIIQEMLFFYRSIMKMNLIFDENQFELVKFFFDFPTDIIGKYLVDIYEGFYGKEDNLSHNRFSASLEVLTKLIQKLKVEQPSLLSLIYNHPNHNKIIQYILGTPKEHVDKPMEEFINITQHT